MDLDHLIFCPVSGDYLGMRIKPTDGGRTLASTLNDFDYLLNRNPDSFTEFLQFLERTDVTVYGISIKPSKLRKLKYELDSRNLGNLVL